MGGTEEMSKVERFFMRVFELIFKHTDPMVLAWLFGSIAVGSMIAMLALAMGGDK